MNHSKILRFTLLTYFAFTTLCETDVQAADSLTLTRSQKQSLDKFRELVKSKLYRDFMQEDVYLLKWLRAKNFDVRRATEFFTQHLKWRKDYKLDTIHDEDFSEFEKDYPIHTNGVDRIGQPILAINFGPEWDVRKAAIAGKLPRLTRWLFKKRDEVVNKIYEGQKQGKNITQWNFIVNLDKLNQRIHLCSQCLPLYTDVATSYELQYPGSYDKLYLINAPQIFEIVMSLIRPILSPPTAAALNLVPPNKEKVTALVFSGIDQDQLPPEFGGTQGL